MNQSSDLRPTAIECITEGSHTQRHGIPTPPAPPPPVTPTQTFAPVLSNFFKGIFHGNGESRGTCNDTELHIAAYNGDINTLRSVLERREGKANLNMRNHLGCTPLRLAVAAGRLSCMEELLSAGADIDLADVKAQTPVMMAVKNAHVECLEMLLRHGADPNGHQHSLYTPLFWAAQEGNIQVLQMLLDYGADTESRGVAYIRNTTPSSPVRVALVYNHLACYRALLLAGAERREELVRHQASMYHMAVSRGKNPDYIQLAYDHGLSFHDRPIVEELVIRKKLGCERCWERITDLFNDPRSLMSACRVTIRDRLLVCGGRPEPLIDRLPLPPSLLRYLHHATPQHTDR